MADNRGDDGLFMFFFLIVLVWGGGYLLWKNFRPQISQGIITVRTVEMKFASIWWDDEDIINVPIYTSTDDERPLEAHMGDNERLDYHPTKFGVWRRFAESVEVQDLTSDHIKVMTYVALWPLRWVFVGIMALLFVWTIFNGPTSKFRRVLGLEGLIIDQAKTFRVIQPFLKFNPNKLPFRAPGAAVPAELPMFAEALGPEEWIAHNEITVTDGKPDHDQAEAAFSEQLGPRWKGVDALPTELKILLATFCLKASRKRQEADDMLGRLSTCWSHDKGLKLSTDPKLAREARKILRDKKLSEITLGNANRHAYVSTALMRALDTARSEGGVLAPAQFVWLRAHNRQLWYPLNNLGRQAFHAEALGVASHYRAEKQINRPIPRPRVGDAIEGLIDHMGNAIMARPIPPTDGKPRKRRNRVNAAANPEAA